MKRLNGMDALLLYSETVEDVSEATDALLEAFDEMRCIAGE